jgi:hypothetical protein
MKQFLLSLFSLCTVLTTLHAQSPNPFKSLNKQQKVITAYGDKFDEFFDTDSIQRIGSVLINIKTKKLVKLLDPAKLYIKFSDNSSSSHWMSIDPHADRYANLSPYTAMGDNPILYIDNDGRDLILSGTPAMQDEYARMLTKTTGYTITIDHETGKLTMGNQVKGAEHTSDVLADLVSSAASSSYAYALKLTGEKGDDKNVFVDNYADATIDVADLKKIEKRTDKAFLAGVLGHFIAEVTSTDDFNNANRKDQDNVFTPAHEKALAKEGEIVGGMLGIGTDPRKTNVSKPTENNTQQEMIYQYGSGNKIADYLMIQGVTGVTVVSKPYVLPNGMVVPSNEIRVSHNGKLIDAQKQ